MPGQLFTTCFLEEGIHPTDAWQEALSQPSELESFRVQALALLDNAAGFHSINEASTEHELIRPLLELLGRAATATRTSPTNCSSATRICRWRSEGGRRRRIRDTPP